MRFDREKSERTHTHTHTLTHSVRFGLVISFDIFESFKSNHIQFINGVKYLFIMSIDIRIKSSLQPFASFKSGYFSCSNRQKTEIF